MLPLIEDSPAPEDEPAPAGEPPQTPPSRGKVLGPGSLAGMLAAFLLLLYAPEAREGLLWLLPLPGKQPVPVTNLADSDAQSLEQSTRRIQAKLDARLPRGSYLIVSTTENRFQLMNGELLTREGICSTGSYVQLRGTDDQEWLFETPRGAFRIQKKTEDPVWTKPDWAFIEEGLPVPPPGSSQRVERGVLGDYSLSLGQGYLLHGTLYQRLLGLPVTHGCVRLGDDDLAVIYHALRVGAPVYIY